MGDRGGLGNRGGGLGGKGSLGSRGFLGDGGVLGEKDLSWYMEFDFSSDDETQGETPQNEPRPDVRIDDEGPNES